MADSTLNSFLASGTSTERLAFTPNPPTPPSGPNPGYFWFETDTGITYSWNGTQWVPLGMVSNIQLVSKQSVSNVSEVDFTGLVAGFDYFVTASEVSSNGSSTHPRVQVGYGSPITWDTTDSNYNSGGASYEGTGFGGTSGWKLMGEDDVLAYDGMIFELFGEVENVSQHHFKSFYSRAVSFTGGSYGVSTPRAVNGLRFYMNSGNISGNFYLYSRSKSTSVVNDPSQVLYYPSEPKGRLTLTSNTPVMIADVVNSSNVYFTPYKGKSLDIFDGNSWKPYTFSELHLILDATNHVIGNIYDIYTFKDSGVIKIGAGPAWANSVAGSSSRGTGAGTTEIDKSQGLWTNSNQINLINNSVVYSNVAVNTALYVGSLYTTYNAAASMQFNPGAASGGSNSYLALYNPYNKVSISSYSSESAGGFTTTNATPEPLNGSTHNRINVLDGLGDIFVELNWSSYVICPGGGVQSGIDVIRNAISGFGSNLTPRTQFNGLIILPGNNTWTPLLGFSYYQLLQFTSGGTATYYNGLINVNLNM
jgi:hypothetical protein